MLFGKNLSVQETSRLSTASAQDAFNLFKDLYKKSYEGLAQSKALTEALIKAIAIKESKISSYTTKAQDALDRAQKGLLPKVHAEKLAAQFVSSKFSLEEELVKLQNFLRVSEDLEDFWYKYALDMWKRLSYCEFILAFLNAESQVQDALLNFDAINAPLIEAQKQIDTMKEAVSCDEFLAKAYVTLKLTPLEEWDSDTEVINDERILSELRKMQEKLRI